MFRKMGLRFLLVGAVAASVACGSIARAKSESPKGDTIDAIEKIAVFPVLYKGERGEKVDEATAKSLDETWWQVRDELTGTSRFVVASRAFLQKADAFQPRGTLSVGDAVILGRYVEADALLTIMLQDRSLTVSVFNAFDGTLAWVQSVELHPSVLIREQIAKVSRALVKEFVASLPYQAKTLKDSLAKQALYEEAGHRFARIQAAGAKIEVGDSAQWISLSRASLEPLFQGGGKVSVKAEGRVTEIRDGEAVVQLSRVIDASAIQVGALVNLPREQERLALAAKPKDSATSGAIVSLLAANSSIEPEAKQAERRSDDSGPMATTLSILGSLAIILLLAF